MNKEIIESIKEVREYKPITYSSFSGYEIKTSKDTYRILISDRQICCEHWGYFASEDDTSVYVGKELLKLELIDMELNARDVNRSGYYFDEGEIQFVNLKCADGSTLQFAVYNAHNGYYGHSILIQKGSEVLLEDCL